jgi:hypothetical protein
MLHVLTVRATCTCKNYYAMLTWNGGTKNQRAEHAQRLWTKQWTKYGSSVTCTAPPCSLYISKSLVHNKRLRRICFAEKGKLRVACIAHALVALHSFTHVCTDRKCDVEICGRRQEADLNERNMELEDGFIRSPQTHRSIALPLHMYHCTLLGAPSIVQIVMRWWNVRVRVMYVSQVSGYAQQFTSRGRPAKCPWWWIDPGVQTRDSLKCISESI